MLALDVLGDIGIVDPSPIVARDLEVLPRKLAANLRVQRERLTDGIYGRRDAELLEQPKNAPDAGAGAVVVKAFGIQIALAHARLKTDNLVDVGLGSGVVVEHRPLGAFLVVEDEAQRERAVVPPWGTWTRAAIAYEVAFVGDALEPGLLDDVGSDISCQVVAAEKVRSNPPPFQVVILRAWTRKGSLAKPNVDSA